MKILLDNCTPIPLAKSLTGHTVQSARRLGWNLLVDAAILAEADKNGFDLIITTDANLIHQQNLNNFKVAVLVITPNRWTVIRQHTAQIIQAVNAALQQSPYVLRL